MISLAIELRTLAETDRLGCLLAAALPDRLTIALRGTLGAGKTRLVEALAAAWQIPRDSVVSPTFVLCQQYVGRRTIYHLDAYRLRNEEEFLDLGPEEWFDAPAVTVIEWADRVQGCLPLDYLDIEIEITGESSRRVTLTSCGPQAQRALEVLKAGLKSGDQDQQLPNWFQNAEGEAPAEL
jgi:tRNA threonylcarbamoyladenosine biosynthesis protein TsaE